MGPPRRKLQATVEETITPPDSLGNGQLIARIVKAEGKNLYTAQSPSSETLLVELEARFRSTIWLKRGSYVLIDKNSLAERDNKIDGEIVNVVRDEKAWRKEKYWPKDFVKQKVAQESDEEKSTVGKMPPAESGDEDEDEDEE